MSIGHYSFYWRYCWWELRVTNFKVCSSDELFSLCRLDRLLRSECPSLVPTVNLEDKRAGRGWQHGHCPELWRVFILHRFFHTNLISFQNESWRLFREMAGEVGTPAVDMHAKVCNSRIFAVRNSETLRSHSSPDTAAGRELRARRSLCSVGP